MENGSSGSQGDDSFSSISISHSSPLSTNAATSPTAHNPLVPAPLSSTSSDTITNTLLQFQRIFSNQILNTDSDRLLREQSLRSLRTHNNDSTAMELSVQIDPDNGHSAFAGDTTTLRATSAASTRPSVLGDSPVSFFDSNPVPEAAAHDHDAQDHARDGGVEEPFSGARVDMHQVSKYLEQLCPFLLLLLLLFLFQHRIGIIIFLWHSSVFMQVNHVIRQQVLARERRSVPLLCCVSLVLALHVLGLYYLFQADELWRSLVLLPPLHSSPLPIIHAVWVILMNDLMVRFATMAVKALVIAAVGARPYPPQKRKALLYATIETAATTYRTMLPIPVWFRYFYAVEQYGHVFSCLLAGLYLTFKITGVCDRMRHCVATLRAYIFKEVQFGKYADSVSGDEMCPICQDRLSPMRDPIVLHCGHIFCEDCVSQWFEREKTCPMCRQPVPTAGTRSHSDGTTSLLLQLF